MVKIETTCEACGKLFSYIVAVKGRKPRALCDDCKCKKQKYGEVLAVKDEVKKKKGFEGLWKGRSGWYRSKAFKKKDIENLLAGDKDRKCIILRYNKYHKNSEDGRPNFIFAFADAREADQIVQELPFWEPDEEDDTLYVTVDEAIRYAREGAYSIKSGYDAYDVYCSCDLNGRTLAEIIEDS
jgi:hypothetical protein